MSEHVALELQSGTQSSTREPDDAPLLPQLIRDVRAQWTVSKGSHKYLVLDNPGDGTVMTKSLETGSQSRHPIAKYLDNGYIFQGPQQSLEKPSEPVSTAIAPASSCDASTGSEAAQVMAADRVEQAVALAERTPDLSEKTATGVPVTQEPGVTEESSASAPPAEPPASSDASTETRIDKLSAEWRQAQLALDLRRVELDKQFRMRIAEAKRRAKPLGQRRSDALVYLDKLRDFVRGEELEMTDEQADALISGRLGMPAAQALTG